jgi:hypothetical protein
MFTIELTRGLGWNAPAMAVILTMERYLGDAETFARQLLKGYQAENPESSASGYRILDMRGQRMKASASITTAPFLSGPTDEDVAPD